MVLFFFQFGTLTPGRNFILLEGIHIFKLSKNNKLINLDRYESTYELRAHSLLGDIIASKKHTVPTLLPTYTYANVEQTPKH